MTISSRTPEGQPNRCPVCRRRLRLSPSWPSADAPCPHCGSLVWFPTAHTPRATGGSATAPEFTLEDFRQQLVQLKRLRAAGEALIGRQAEGTELDLGRIQGILDAMTQEERGRPDILNKPRCRRIAAGSGVSPPDIERFLKQFHQVRRLMRRLAQMNVGREGGF